MKDIAEPLRNYARGYPKSTPRKVNLYFGEGVFYLTFGVLGDALSLPRPTKGQFCVCVCVVPVCLSRKFLEAGKTEERQRIRASQFCAPLMLADTCCIQTTSLNQVE